MGDVVGLGAPGREGDDFADGMHVGDAVRFFLDSKRAGGRSERTLTEYRKKLDLFQRWVATRLEGEGAEEVRVAKGKGNKERLVPIGPRLRRSLRRYLKVKDALVPADAPSPTSS